MIHILLTASSLHVGATGFVLGLVVGVILTLVACSRRDV